VGEYWQSSITFDVEVAYRGAAQNLNRIPDAAAVATAVERALAVKGFNAGGKTMAAPVTSVSAVKKAARRRLSNAVDRSGASRKLDESDTHGHFDVTVVAFAPQLHPISEAVREVSFGDEVAKKLRQDGNSDISDTTATFHPVRVQGAIVSGEPELLKFPSPSPPPSPPPSPAPALPPSPIAPAAADPPVGGGGPGLDNRAGLAEANEAAQATSEDAVPGWGVFLIVLLLLCVLSPVFCWLYAHFVYGSGKETTWFKYRLTHSNPTLPFLYVPREDREALLLALLEKEKPPAASLEQEQAGKV